MPELDVGVEGTAFGAEHHLDLLDRGRAAADQVRREPPARGWHPDAAARWDGAALHVGSVHRSARALAPSASSLAMRIAGAAFGASTRVGVAEKREHRVRTVVRTEDDGQVGNVRQQARTLGKVWWRISTRKSRPMGYMRYAIRTRSPHLFQILKRNPHNAVGRQTVLDYLDTWRPTSRGY